MNLIKIRIDDREIEAQAGMTILQAADTAGIRIPTLCYHRDFVPSGSCRICVLELEGSSRLVGACHTPVAVGMALHTHTSKVLSARKATIELLLAGHTGPCVRDLQAERCELHRLASDLEVGAPRFNIEKSRFYPVEDVSPYVHRDLARCILCDYEVTNHISCSHTAKEGVVNCAIPSAVLNRATCQRGSRRKICSRVFVKVDARS